MVDGPGDRSKDTRQHARSGSCHPHVSTDTQGGFLSIVRSRSRGMMPPCARSSESDTPDGRQIPTLHKEAAMILNDTLDRSAQDAFMSTEARWLERIPPELEWDESEIALLVEQIVGASPMASYA